MNTEILGVVLQNFPVGGDFLYWKVYCKGL